jgi:acetaldehyde dehydrogenase
MSEHKRLKVAILGTGNIGTDLLVKVLRSEFLEMGPFVGRSVSSPGVNKAMALGVRCSSESLAFLERHPEGYDIVFDCTSAGDHLKHAPVLKALGKIVIDLTPAKIGPMAVPAVNLSEAVGEWNVNMVTCGGQASIPVAWACGRAHDDVEYIEVVSSISSRSAGPATRRNLDEYIHTTEKGIQQFSGCRRAKAILNLNPAEPCINMQTTVLAKVARPDLPRFTAEFEAIAERMRTYVPGYTVLVPPTLEGGRIVTMIKVTGLGDYLPAYAGNLDIINCAAIAMAEEYARQWDRSPAGRR